MARQQLQGEARKKARAINDAVARGNLEQASTLVRSLKPMRLNHQAVLDGLKTDQAKTLYETIVLNGRRR
jgi:hypothetical protein